MSNYPTNAANAATITPVLAAGSTTSPYYYQVNLTQRLCGATCTNLTPVFTPIYSMAGLSNVGTSQYVATVHVEGVICYVPANGTACCTKAQVVSQDFDLPFYSTTAPTSVTIAAGKSVNAVVGTSCQNFSRNFVSEVPLTLTVSTT